MAALFPAAAATFTSKATGNYDAAGQTTWNEAGDPDNAAAYDITINATHTVTTTLRNRKGTFSVGQGKVEFAAEDAGHVAISGLVSGTTYALVLELANIDTTIDDVVTELSKNPAFSGVTALGATSVRVGVTSPVTGTGYFVWDDNEADSVNNLGADVVSLSTFFGAVFRFR